MMIPIVCFSCGKPVGHLHAEFEQRVKKGEDPAKVMDSLGLTKYCCRRMLLSQTNYMDEIMKYPRF
jgi:DNA-directed RNA polymerase subunit N